MHVLIEANQVTDLMVRHGLIIKSSYQIFYFAPNFICNALLVDQDCISFP